MKRISRIVALGMGVLGLVCGSVRAAQVGTAFTYQGELVLDGTPVEGDCDFVFTLFDDPIAGNQIGVPETFTGGDAVSVVGGVFTVVLDFGEDVFDGNARFLEIKAACPAGGTLQTMTPRQEVRPVPYALALPAMRVQQSAISPNIIGGFSGNFVGVGVVGATISGGGKPDEPFPSSRTTSTSTGRRSGTPAAGT